MTQLNGTSTRIALGRDVFVRAPGLVGSVDLLQPGLLGTRGDDDVRATPALTDALARQGFATRHSLEINATVAGGPAAAPLRGPDDRPMLVLEVPAIGPQRPQVVLLADEIGVVTWHFAEPVPAQRAVRFVVPADTVTDVEQTPATQRGLVSVIGKKLLSVLVFPLIEAGAQILAQRLAESWENAHRPARLRRFVGPADSTTVNSVGGESWDVLSEGRALLFVHGTFSTSQAFGSLNRDTWGTLAQRYQGRLFAYDHPTLSVDPQQNAEALVRLVPPGRRIDVDIVAHSRGGLVARALSSAAIEGSCPVNVSKIVHVGVPNAGTALADVDRHTDFVDRICSLLNLVPDSPLSMVAGVLDGVLTLVRIIACNGIGTLPGLAAMNPSADWLTALSRKPASPHVGYAIDSDFEPTGGLLRLVRGADGLADAVFQSLPNDMVVPSTGVYDAGTAKGFPIPVERRLGFGTTDGVWHCSYFGRPQTSDRLLQWLAGVAGS